MAELNKCTMVVYFVCEDGGCDLGSKSCPYYTRSENYDLGDRTCWYYDKYNKICRKREARIEAIKKFLESISWTGGPKNV
jgi:hypothetical protein